MADYSRLSSYFFAVEIDGIQTARFQKCEGLESETEVIEYEEGGGEIHRFKGRTRFPNIILEKGINDNDELFKWHKQVVDGNIERKSGAIVLCNLAGEEIKRWNFFKAFPCRWVGPELDYKNKDTFAVERIEIAHEGIEVDESNQITNSNISGSTTKEVKNEYLDKLIDDYLDDVEANSEYRNTINRDQVKNKKFEKISSVENADKRQEFNRRKKKLLSDWEESNRKEWPKYEHDVYDDKGILIRKAGMRYDAHHIQPLEMGGKNTAKNLTPISAEKHYDHKGIHAYGSPFDKLKNYLEEN